MTTYLTTAEVMERYRLRDPRAARAIMREVGCIKTGRGLLVQLRDLDSRDAANWIVDSSPKPINDPSVTEPRPHRANLASVPTELNPGWWNDAS